MIKIPTPVRYREFKKIQELEKEWDTTFQHLLEHCKNGHLKIEINWRLLREREHNKLCVNNDGFTEPLIYLGNQGELCFNSPCWRCKWYGKTESCLFEHPPMLDIDNLSYSQKRDLHRVSISYVDLIVRNESIRHFEEWVHKESEQPNRGKQEKHSCEAINAMIDAWDSIVVKKEMPEDIPADKSGNEKSGISAKTSFKQAVRAYLHHTYEIPVCIVPCKKGQNPYKFSQDTIKQMSAVLNACYPDNAWNQFVKESQKG